MNFKKCPFCGKTETVRLQSASEYDIETYDIEHFDNDEQWHVVCDANEINSNDGHGGCGASTGFFDSEENAINSWNTRA